MKLLASDVDAHLKRLNLANARRIWPELVLRAEEESWSCREFPEILVGEEVAHRQQTRLQRCTRQAKFPFPKTIDDFDFQLQSQLRLSLLGSYLSPDFVTEGRNLIRYGRSGRGKTHLAVAIAYRAIHNGFEALFTTAAALIDELCQASRAGRFGDVLQRYARIHVWVIDVEPARRIEVKHCRLRPLWIGPDEFALRFLAALGPTAEVSFEGAIYSMPPDAVGLPADLYVFPQRIRIVAGRHDAEHPRLKSVERSILPEHRAGQLAAVRAQRGKRYLQHELLRREIDQTLRQAISRALQAKAYGSDYVRHFLRHPDWAQQAVDR